MTLAALIVCSPTSALNALAANGAGFSHREYAVVGSALASRGVLTLVSDYRLYPQARCPDFLADSAQALAYAIEHVGELGADP